MAKLTLGEALADFGFFPMLFSVVVGGSSVLAIFEAVFIDHQLIAAFQWIVDGYNRIADVLGAVFEPLILPALDWFNRMFDWNLVLAPHWRPLFVLGMVMVAGASRTAWRDGDIAFALQLGLLGAVGALAGAVGCGLLPLSGGWWAQGLVAAVPTATPIVLAGTYIAIDNIIRGQGAHVAADNLSMAARYVATFGALAFALGAGLSFVPGVTVGAGVLALATMVAVLGIGILATAFAAQARVGTRFGLTIIGGFVAAGAVLIADAAVKALT